MIVGIRGSGIAATGCAHLLRGAGLRVAHAPAPRATVPTVMLSDAALSLLRGVFDRPELFAGRPRIKRRVIAWSSAVPVVVPHEAVLLSEAEVQAELAGSGPSAPEDRAMSEQGDDSIDQSDFTIFAAPPMPEGAMRVFGERHAVAARVRLRDPACAEECRIEAVDAGWLFLVPASPDEGRLRGWLMGVGGALDDLLADSRLIAPLVEPLGSSSIPFLAAPRLAMPLIGADWLACGSAALGFDPICGDGTAQSVREAILAAAVLTEMADGGDARALRTHYQSMLIAAMRRHLSLCANFYRNGGRSDWWRGQFDALMQGYGWCTQLLADMPEPRFMLQDFRLVPRQEAA
jgi:hypothetical protein